MGWCLWLLAGWLLNLLWDYPAGSWVETGDGLWRWKIPYDAFEQVVRGMFQTMLLGMGLIWPGWRLSLPPQPRAGLETAKDLAALWLVSQVVVMPMRTLIDWTATQALLISMSLAVWGGVFALWVWVGSGGGPAIRRAVAMGGCAVTLFGAWVIAYATGWTALLRYSPQDMLWRLCGEQPVDEADIAGRLIRVALAAAALWIVLCVMARRRQHSGPRQSPDHAV